MYVYVRNLDGTALMPCTPAKARKLLRTGKAKISTHRPFTIQLTWKCEGQVQPITCGIDKGSSTTGLACVGTVRSCSLPTSTIARMSKTSLRIGGITARAVELDSGIDPNGFSTVPPANAVGGYHRRSRPMSRR